MCDSVERCAEKRVEKYKAEIETVIEKYVAERVAMEVEKYKAEIEAEVEKYANRVGEFVITGIEDISFKLEKYQKDHLDMIKDLFKNNEISLRAAAKLAGMTEAAFIEAVTI